MEKKSISGIMLTQLVVSMLILAYNIQPVETESTIRVPDDYQTIQEAINAANSGDTVSVGAGTYFENVVVDKSVSLTGQNRETTIIDGKLTGVVVTVTADNVTISGFTIQNSSYGDRGVYISDCNGITVTDNIVSHNRYGIWLHTSNYSSITDNVIASNNGTGIFWWKSKSTIIQRNTISDNAYDGIFMRYITHSIVRENTITTDKQDGIGLYDSSENIIINNTISNNKYAGIYSTDSSNNTFSANTISNNDWGILLDSSNSNTISGNTVSNNYNGTVLCQSSDNIAYHNNFLANTQQVYDYSWNDPHYPPSINVWDDGYPSGGNYWSDYKGVDADGDGIGDIPYVIDDYNQDNYPLMTQYVISDTAPIILILSPENTTYTTSSVILNFTVDEVTSWIGFSLDGQANETIVGTTTISDLSDGSHSITVYANDTAGNVGASEVIYFTIETPQEEEVFPTWIVATIVILAVLGIAVYLLLKIRKRS